MMIMQKTKANQLMINLNQRKRFRKQILKRF